MTVLTMRKNEMVLNTHNLGRLPNTNKGKKLWVATDSRYRCYDLFLIGDPRIISHDFNRSPPRTGLQGSRGSLLLFLFQLLLARCGTHHHFRHFLDLA